MLNWTVKNYLIIVNLNVECFSGSIVSQDVATRVVGFYHFVRVTLSGYILSVFNVIVVFA